jgi:GrpB-like predicted nucleotidyltransferase (UPF0157 family)
MLTQNQENYLKKLSSEKANEIVRIYPYDDKLGEISDELMTDIKKTIPKSQLFFLGSAALKITGMNDIDISIVSSNSFDADRNKLIELYGIPKDSLNTRYALWEFKKNGFSVELSLNDNLAPPLQEQIDVCEVLRHNKNLLVEYEQIKLAMNGKTYREYQEAKYEFFNRVLSTS